MQIKHLPSTESEPVSELTLETPEERSLTDGQLVALVRDCVGFTFNECTQRYDLSHRVYEAKPVPAIGHVRRIGDRVSVTVLSEASPSEEVIRSRKVVALHR